MSFPIVQHEFVHANTSVPFLDIAGSSFVLCGPIEGLEEKSKISNYLIKCAVVLFSASRDATQQFTWIFS